MAAEPEKMLRYFTSIIDNSEDILSHHNAQVYGVDFASKFARWCQRRRY